MPCDVQTVRKFDHKCDVVPCLQDSIRLPLVICKTKQRSRITVTLYCGTFLLLNKFFNLVTITDGKCT